MRRKTSFYYTRDLLLDEDRERLIAADIMRAMYFETLRPIEAHDYDVFSERLRVPRYTQAFIALKQWLHS